MNEVAIKNMLAEILTCVLNEVRAQNGSAPVAAPAAPDAAKRRRSRREETQDRIFLYAIIRVSRLSFVPL